MTLPKPLDTHGPIVRVLFSYKLDPRPRIEVNKL